MIKNNPTKIIAEKKGFQKRIKFIHSLSKLKRNGIKKLQISKAM
jgi:hypothetical protein